MASPRTLNQAERILRHDRTLSAHRVRANTNHTVQLHLRGTALRIPRTRTNIKVRLL